ncbi:MAG TPA: PLP-dependent aspartate aminotransferase family protein [Fimbriimonadaceae bacterium]|nr:PLP-dependent aspartate aminotransferase family protein [Fimbriimonadaceae bacterium]HRJ97759.1 PLP-dependent aspartate aminotransferase family protein [Fimbriimonadaceae bacterium]
MPSIDTLAVHAGVEPDPLTGAVMTPIYQTSTYAQTGPGEHKGYEYSRTDNPTRTPLQRSLAELEGGQHALVFASGMSATDAVLNLLSAGDHVVAGDDLYGGTYRLFTQVAARRGLEFTFVDTGDLTKVEEAMRPSTKLVWTESPTNPMMRLCDIGAIGRLAKASGALMAVDNTFATPYFQRPLALGADIVMHSMTKFLNGHSDVVMGCLALRDDDLMRRLKFLQNSIGAVPAPMDCFLALRGIKTFALRMQRHGENGLRIASWLEAHPKIVKVFFPGLASHPQHDLAARQMSGFGGMMSFLVRSDLAGTLRFLSSVRLCALAESLGGVETLIEHPAIMTHASVPPEVRREIGIHDNLVRLSVGIEAPEDIEADLEHALGTV